MVQRKIVCFYFKLYQISCSHSDMVPSSLHIGNELLEVKKSRQTLTVTCNPSLHKQYTVAVAKVLDQLKKGNRPKNVTSKGLFYLL